MRAKSGLGMRFSLDLRTRHVLLVLDMTLALLEEQTCGSGSTKDTPESHVVVWRDHELIVYVCR